MKIAAVQAALRAFAIRRPFRPFTVELVSGLQFTVRHPEAVTFVEGVLYFVGPDRTRRLFDSESVCQVFESPASP